MRSQIRVAVQVLGAMLLIGIALFCGYGFLASFELGFPNVFHFLYGTAGLATLLGAAWLVHPAFNWLLTARRARPTRSLRWNS